MSLDFSKPYGEVHGLPGAVFEQNGRYYKSDGSDVLAITPYIEEEFVEDTSIPPPIACYEQPTEPMQHVDDKSVDAMHWKHLKVLVESFGGEWTTRQAAIEFMKGK